MRRIIIVTLVALTGLTSVAAADRPHVRDHRGGVHVQTSRQHRNHDRHRNYDRHRHVRHDRSRHVSRPRVVIQRNYRYVRKPIYVQRPVIRYRYTNYYQRPALIVENYPPMVGYYW